MGSPRPPIARLISTEQRHHKLIKHRLDHPLASCVELAESVRARFGLTYCDVAPSDPGPQDSIANVGDCAAACLESYLASKTPGLVTDEATARLILDAA